MFQRKESIIKIGRSVFAVILVSLFPSVFLYAQNAKIASFREIMVPSLAFCGMGIVFFSFFFLLSKTTFNASVGAILTIIVLLNYSFIEKSILKIQIPNLRYWHVAPTIVFILLSLSLLICKKMPEKVASNINKIVAITFSSLILFNLVIAIPDIVTKNYYRYEEVQIKEDHPENLQNEDKQLPNFYYLVFDEYASFNQIEKYYGYNNLDFAKYLETLGFNVSYSSSNDSRSTEVVMTNIVNLDYVTEAEHSTAQRMMMRHDNILFSILQNSGYMITLLEGAPYYGFQKTGTQSSAKTIEGRTIADLMISNTIFWPFRKADYGEETRQMLAYMDQLKEGAFPAGNTFVFSHFAQPHMPYKFDEYGNQLLGVGQFDTENKQYYLGNYIYTTKLIKDIADSLVQNDPTAVILIASDHGARETKGEFLETDICQILNAVYYKGEKLDIEGLSGINTLRTLLNKLLMLNLELIPEPQAIS